MAINVNEIIYPSDINKILRGIDGVGMNIMPIKWTDISQDFTTSSIYSICYGNGKFIAGGLSGKMGYSTDGITWVAIQGFTTSSIESICYGNGKFVAGDYNGGMGYSTDGINWKAISQDFTPYSVYSICYGNGKFVVGGESGSIAYCQSGIL